MPLTSAYQGKKRRKCNIKNGEPNLTYAALSEELWSEVVLLLSHLSQTQTHLLKNIK